MIRKLLNSISERELLLFKRQKLPRTTQDSESFGERCTSLMEIMELSELNSNQTFHQELWEVQLESCSTPTEEFESKKPYDLPC